MITGMVIFAFAGIALALQMFDYLSTCIFKRCKAWGWIVDYFIHRHQFKAWLKSPQNVSDEESPRNKA